MQNNRPALLLVVAVIIGILAALAIGAYVNTDVQNKIDLAKEEAANQQKEMVAQIQNDHDQKMAAMKQELERVKTEQAQVVQKQIAELQSKMQAQVKAAPAKRIKPSLALKTPAGKRAVTVLVPSLAAVGGLLNPGDMVDVIAQLKVPESVGSKESNTVTAVVFQGLEVLAVNTNLDETGAYYDEQQAAAAVKVTVAVDPDEAGLLSFADKNGDLELALRSGDDSDRQMVKASTWKTLADYILENQGTDISLPDELKGVQGAEAPKSSKPNIQIFRGGKEL
jgi:pilus assembly protein CpaB